MNLGKLIHRVESEGAKEKACHNVFFNNTVSQSTRMKIDATILKCKEARGFLDE